MKEIARSCLLTCQDAKSTGKTNGRIALLIRHPGIFIYLFHLLTLLAILWQARQIGLLPMPVPGMDQLTMLQAAAGLYGGNPLPDNYLYPQIYTWFLTLLIAVSRGDLVIMRLLQAAVCALIPVLIYRLARRLRFGRDAAILGALLYCLYAPAALISLDFLRAAPLALCFLGAVLSLAKGFMAKQTKYYLLSGIMAGICILGRENFVPVVVLPLCGCAFPHIRRHLTSVRVGAYLGGLAASILPMVTWNLIHHGSAAIIPGGFTSIMTIFYGQETVGSGNRVLFQKMLANMPVQWGKFFSSYEMANSLSVYAHRELAPILKMLFVPFNLLVSLALPALLLAWRKPGVLLPAVAVLGYAASISVFDMLYRYRIPVVPLLCCLAGYGLALLLSPSIRRNRRLAATLAVIACFIMTYQSPDRLRPPGERISVAKAMIALDRLGQAENYIKKMSRDGLDTRDLEAMLRQAQWQRK